MLIGYESRVNSAKNHQLIVKTRKTGCYDVIMHFMTHDYNVLIRVSHKLQFDRLSALIGQKLTILEPKHVFYVLTPTQSIVMPTHCLNSCSIGLWCADNAGIKNFCRRSCLLGETSCDIFKL